MHDVNCMTPLGRLHTTSEGCTKYIFETLVKLISGTMDIMDLIKKFFFLFTMDGGETVKDTYHEVLGGIVYLPNPYRMAQNEEPIY